VPFYSQDRTFTKTGLGQNIGKSPLRATVSQLRRSSTRQCTVSAHRSSLLHSNRSACPRSYRWSSNVSLIRPSQRCGNIFVACKGAILCKTKHKMFTLDRLGTNIGGKVETAGRLCRCLFQILRSLPVRKLPPTHTANCIIIDHFSAFEPGLVAPFLYAA
jgi:hypothetical protein